jgi:activator of HSP90 ATPase
MSIHQEVTINAAPEAVYDTLLSSEKFTKMTGGRKADISREAGGAASMFGGDIQARNVELVPGKRVVQAWRAGGWPDGVYSLVKFELNAEGKGTKLVFDQVGHPADATEMLEGGWHQMYWTPMNAMLGGK